MNLMQWFICWVADNHNTFSPHELQELNVLIKRIKVELQDSSDSLTRSEEYQHKNPDLSQSHDDKTSCQDSLVNEVDEIESDVSNFGAHDIFLSLVKIYLKDAKQINLSYQSSTTESSSISEEELQLDNDSNEKDSLVCSNQETDLQSNSCSLTSGEKNCDGIDCSPETNPVQTNCSNSDAASSEGRPTTSSKTLESCKKLRHIRQDLKKLASNLLKLDQNTDTDATAHLNNVLSSNRLELEAIDCEGNERLNTAREVLIELTEELVTRLKTVNPPSSSASNEQPPDSGKSNTSPLDRIEQMQKLAERVNEDIKLGLFDSRTDKDFINFDEKLTNYLIQLDSVLCADDESLLVARKKVVKYIEQLICCLEVKLLLDSFLINNIDDPSSSVTQDETVKRIQEVETLIENVEYLSNTSDEYLDNYFSVVTLLSKCLIQLRYVECQNDVQLLNKRQKVVDYVDKLLTQLENASNFTWTKPCDEQVPHCSETSAKGFECIKKVEQESERLNVHIEFGSFQSRTDRIYIYVEEMLTKLLINLDSINCDGNEEMRAARKKAVQYINQLTENLEAKIPS